MLQISAKLQPNRRPPNLLIGSAANLNFNDFAINLAPIVVINLIIFTLTVRFLLKGKMHVSLEIKTRIKELNAAKAITDSKLLVECLIVLAGVLALFLTHHIFNLEVATISLLGLQCWLCGRNKIQKNYSNMLNGALHFSLLVYLSWLKV